MRRHWLHVGGFVGAALLVSTVLVGCDAADPSPSPTGSSTSTSSPTATAGDVPTTFPVQQHQPFEAPQELRSKDGVLDATFTLKKQDFDVAGTKVQGFAYDGQFIGPTLYVKPGDTVKIHLRNDLDEPTNLHSHGMFVSPIGISDNVLRVMQPSSDNDFVLNLPKDVDPGTYWYHSHLHGRTEAQVFAGLAGVFVVEGLQERMPAELRDIPDLVLALKDLQVKDGAIITENIDSNAPTTRTVNGQVDPVLTVPTNQTTLLRLANISADIWYKLALDGTQFRVVAEDANPVAEVWTADELVLPPGKRYDVLVRWPAGRHPRAEDAGVQQRARGRHLPRATAGHRDGRWRPGRRRPLADVAGPGVGAGRRRRSTAPASSSSARTPRPTSSTSTASSSTAPGSTSPRSSAPSRSGPSRTCPGRRTRSTSTSTTTSSRPSTASPTRPRASRTSCRYRPRAW